MLCDVQHGTREANEVEVETASRYANIPDSVQRYAAEHDHASIDDVVDE